MSDMDGALWTPGGWKHRGLWSPSITARATRTSIVAAVERLERSTSNPNFELLGVEHITRDCAAELAHTYLGLRRRYPGVYVDSVDVGAKLGDELGHTTLYSNMYPTLHRHAVEHWQEHSETLDVSDLTTAVCNSEPVVSGRWRPRDLSCDGFIVLSRCLGHTRCLRATHRVWDRRRATAQRRGTTTWFPEIGTGIAACVLAHEYGHLLEAAMWRHSEQLAHDVYAELSEELHGTYPYSTNQWRRHLINYPSWAHPAGPATGGGRRRGVQRSLARKDIGYRLGRYATYDREELFAESFMLATCGHDRGLRARFAGPIRALLADAGIAQR